ncbi:MAG: hypothetical protein OQL08_04540 [Gammaproteobacteria bacterium]|nr:hypothetical protein [Gammaproteobacteria bacterium]
MIRRRYCPKANSCEAPVCPMDPDWKYQTQMAGDQVCFYLYGGKQLVDFNHVDLDTQAKLKHMIIEFITEINAQYGHDYIRQKLREAEQSSQIMGQHRLS